MLDKKESIMKKVEWPCLFLPLPTCFEAEFMNSLRNGEFFENFLRETGIKSERIRPVLMHIEGEDPHDWFNHLCAEIHFEYKVLIREFYFLWIEKPEVKANIEKFTNDLVGII
jgi:hypothetical protein